MGYFYPSLMTGKFAETVDFYEDYFGFVPVKETEDYVLLKGSEGIEGMLSIRTGKTDETIIAPDRGITMNLASKDLDAVFDRFYMEGADMTTEISLDFLGRRHFTVRDPNGLSVCVHEDKSDVP